MCFTWILFCEWQCLILFSEMLSNPISRQSIGLIKFWSKDSRITWGSKKRNVGTPSSMLKFLSTWNSTKNPILKTIELNNVAYPVEKVTGLWCARIPKGRKLLHGSSISVGANVLQLWAWAAQAQHGHRHLTANFANKKQWAVCLSIPTTKTATSTHTFVKESARRWR